MLTCLVSSLLAVPSALGVLGPGVPEHTVSVPGLENATDVLFDSWGVSHVRPGPERDAWVALGFVHARDRFFQLDHTRRTIAGTRAEILGVGYVRSDHDVRTLGLVWAAEQMWNGLADTDRAVLQAYSEGVNGWIEAAKGGHPGLTFPPEYFDLGIAPDELVPWKSLDSIMILGGFIFGLTQAIELDLLKTLLAIELSDDLFEDMVRLAPADTTPALYPGEYSDHLRPSDPGFGDDAGASRHRAFVAPLMPEAQGALYDGLEVAAKAAFALWERIAQHSPWLLTEGSNAWAASPSRTATGHSIFASDNHVGTPMPPIYYESHLASAEAGLNVYGVTIPGAPVFANGFNDAAAWAYTILPVDGTDLFWERMPFPDRVSFMGRLVDVEVREETYWARVGGELVDRTDLIEDPVTRIVPHHGPILGQALNGRRALSYRWVGFEPSTFVEPLLRRMRSTDLDEALQASQDIDVFGANMIVADVNGQIGYTVTGTFPIRRFKDLYPPFWPRLGGGLWEWRGALGREDYLSSVTPERGFLATSNNDPVGYAFDNCLTNDPVYYAVGHDPGFRQRRIHEELIARTPLTVLDMMETQFDVTVEVAERLIPHLRIAADSRPDLVTPAMESAISALESWDLRAVREAYEPSIFDEWWPDLAHAVLDDNAGSDYYVTEIAINALLRLLESPEAVRTGELLWDDANTVEVETREDMVLGAMRRSVDYLERRFGTEDQTAWLWGEIHTKRFGHPLGGEYDYPPRSQPSRSYDAGPFTVNPMQSGFRMVADMNPAGIEAWMVLPGGNSGILGSAHYADQAEMYFEGEYRKVRFAAEDVDADVEEIWHLVPGPLPTRRRVERD